VIVVVCVVAVPFALSFPPEQVSIFSVLVLDTMNMGEGGGIAKNSRHYEPH
jgi:hypothetical protein